MIFTYVIVAAVFLILMQGLSFFPAGILPVVGGGLAPEVAGGLLAGGGTLGAGLLGKKEKKQKTGPSFLPPQFLIPQLIFGIIDMIGAQKRNKEARELRDKLVGLQQGSINRVLTAGQGTTPSLTVGGRTFSNPPLSVDRSILGA